MRHEIEGAKRHFIQGCSRIAHFWGFPKAMGAVYASIYLSPEPVTLDGLVDLVGISKGAASTTVRNLERLGMIVKEVKLGDRKDYYSAETDFWKIIRDILRAREKVEFDRALRTVAESLEMLESAGAGEGEEEEQRLFYRERMAGMRSFFDGLDSLVATVIAIDKLRLDVVTKLFGKVVEK